MAQKSKQGTKKAPAKKAAGKKAAASKASAKKAAGKATAAKSPAKKTSAKKAPSKKAAATAKKAAPEKKAAGTAPTKKATAKKAPTKKVPAKKASVKKAPSKKAPARKSATRLPKPAKVSGYSKRELAQIRERLSTEIDGLEEEVGRAQSDIASRLRDGTDGAGEDQADQGSKASEREHEISLANNSRDLIAQNERAVERVDSGVYGVCESCGGPIGKARLQVFPRATLCVDCKQQEERR